MTDLEEARTEVVQEIASVLLEAAGAAMHRHGNDPNGGAILAAGFAVALNNIGKHIDPRVPQTVKEML